MTLAYNLSLAAEKAFENGFSAGEERGRNEGISIGMSQGRNEGARDAKIETAKKFLAMGLSVEQVANGTGLSPEEIEKLQTLEIKTESLEFKKEAE